jgi:putative transcriptional regulator
MIEILQSKNSATRFQMLVEIAAAGQHVPQRAIAARLGITPQAISDYARQLIDEGLITSSSRNGYRVSVKGVNWMLKIIRELNDYLAMATRSVTNLTVCAAVAEIDIRRGSVVSLHMNDGLLYASSYSGKGAKGVALSKVKKGQDLDVSNIEGLVELTRGNITILQVPSIGRGGSRKTDLKQLRERAGNGRLIGAIGIEAVVALRQIDIEPRYIYGVTEAAIEAVRCGLNFIIACTDDAVSELVRRLGEEALTYEMIDLTIKSK